MADANSACAELGLNAVNPTAPTQLVVFEQTPKALFEHQRGNDDMIHDWNTMSGGWTGGSTHNS